MSNSISYNGIYAFHPGYYIMDFIDDLNITQSEFAARMGTSAKNISLLVSGKSRLSDDLAAKLSAMTGTSIDLWLSLQQAFDKKIIDIEHEKLLDAQLEVSKSIDYSFFVRNANLPKTRDYRLRTINLCAFLHVSDLRILKNQDILVNFRSSNAALSDKNIINAQAWLQTAINIAKTIVTANFNIDKLKAFLPQIRSMTLDNPDNFLPRLYQIFQDCGIAFILLPHLKNSAINGAVKWEGRNRVVLALNDRRCYADTFWFSMFHEIKHIMQQKIKTVFVQLASGNISLFNSSLEKEADQFARNYLIPPEKYLSFIEKKDFSRESIIDFSSSIGIHAGIVVGRLQFDKHIKPSMFNQLRTKHKIVLEASTRG